MTCIALIDDDATEAMILEGMLAHGAPDITLVHYTSVAGFNQAVASQVVDLVLLDRRIPPHSGFQTSLAELADGPYDGAFILISAGPIEQAEYAESPLSGRIVRTVSKLDLLTPKAVASMLASAL